MSIPTLEFLLSEEEQLLTASLRQLLEDRRARETARRFWETDADYDRGLWAELAALGFAGMAAPEAFGGTGAGYRQLGLVSEELGYACAAVPFEMHSVSLRLLGAGADTPALAAALRSAGSGATVLTAAIATPSIPEAAGPIMLSVSDGMLAGQLALVPEGAIADQFIVVAGDALYLATGGVRRQSVAALGMNRRADLEFVAVQGTRIPIPMADAVRRGCRDGALLFASRQVGMGSWLVKQTADYAAARVQFGRPIGSFQAIQHKLAELFIAQSAAVNLVRYAADLLDSGAEAELEVSRAKAFVAAAMWRATTEAHQIHAGVGFILEHPLHLYFSQSRGAESLFGDARSHLRRLGAAIVSGNGYRWNALMGAG